MNSTVSGGAAFYQRVNHRKVAGLEINHCRPIRTAASWSFCQVWNRPVRADHSVYLEINLSTRSDRVKSHEETVYREALNTTVEQSLGAGRTYAVELLEQQ